MKKYKVTDKHPELKEGVVIEMATRFIRSNTMDFVLQYSKMSLKNWVDSGWIKEEIQEPKWTDDDMVDFAHDFIFNHKNMDAKEQLSMYKSKS